MKSRKHVILTHVNAKFGDFLINHWLASLQDKVDLINIDVVVLDYGLTEGQRKELRAKNVVCYPAEMDQFILNVRYRDMADFLRENEYDQVLSIDGGDIIFQSDISHLLGQNKDSFRAVCQEFEVPLEELVSCKHDFTPENYKMIRRSLTGKPTINGGVLLGPSAKFIELWSHFQHWCVHFNCFGTDQLMVNYVLYRDGFNELDNRYNCAIVTKRSRVHIRKGVFYSEAGDVIPVVHNAGKMDLTRCVRNFGYGKGFNQKKRVFPPLIRFLFLIVNGYKRLKQCIRMTPR